MSSSFISSVHAGLKQLFDIDLNNLRILAEQLDKGDENRDFKVPMIGCVP
jgi:hypothetical protein